MSILSRLGSIEHLNSEPRIEQATGSLVELPNDQHVEEEGDEDEAEHDYLQNDEEEENNQQQQQRPSRTGSNNQDDDDDDDDQEWILEKIIKRANRPPQELLDQYFDNVDPEDAQQEEEINLEDLDDDELIAQHKTVGLKVNKRAKLPNEKKSTQKDKETKWRQLLKESRVLHFLCKWKTFSKPTWETRETLIDFGYVEEIRKFEESLKIVKEPELSPIEKEIKKYLRYGNRDEIFIRGAHRFTTFERIFPKWFEHLYDAFAWSDPNLRIVAQVNIAPRDATCAFTNRWARKMAEVDPIIVYHGTQRKFLKGISERGFRVPYQFGKDEKQRSELKNPEFFNSIGASKSPSGEIFCCGHSGIMIACVALDSPALRQQKLVTTDSFDGVADQDSGRFLHFSEPDLIVPVWALFFDTRDEHEEIIERETKGGGGVRRLKELELTATTWCTTLEEFATVVENHDIEFGQYHPDKIMHNELILGSEDERRRLLLKHHPELFQYV